MSLFYTPGEIPKLPQGWLARLTKEAFDPGDIAAWQELQQQFEVSVSELAKIYVEPEGQFLLDESDVTASHGEEYAHGHPFPLLGYLAAFVVNRHLPATRLFVLGPQGCGKTSLLAMLAAASLLNSPRPPHFHYLRFRRNIMCDIPAAPRPAESVLFVDGVDEEVNTVRSLSDQLRELLEGTAHFSKVIITSAADCLSLQVAPRGGRAYVELSGYNIPAVTFVPFDRAQIHRYVTHRLASDNARVKAAVTKVLQLAPGIARPLLLDFVTELLQATTTPVSLYHVLDQSIETRIQSEIESHSKGLQASQVSAYACHAAVSQYDALNTSHFSKSSDVITKNILLTARVLTAVAGGVRFAHQLYRNFFITKAIIQSIEQPRYPFPASPALLQMIRSWLTSPDGRQKRGAVRWASIDFTGANCADWDFSGASLNDAIFDSADCKHADFANAQLRGTSFRQACLLGANLVGAACDYADFAGTDLSETNLRNVSFRGANLRGARLGGAVLSSVCLRGADLREAQLFNAQCRAIDYDDATTWPAGFDPAQISTAADLQR